jgi:hypothetical protein
MFVLLHPYIVAELLPLAILVLRGKVHTAIGSLRRLQWREWKLECNRPKNLRQPEG